MAVMDRDIAKSCLVIDAHKVEAISMDGPALKITMQLQSARLFPLRRLSRVHVVGAVSNGFEALIHCAEQQIPVAFFSQRGKLRCQLYYPVLTNGIISHWLEHVEFDEQAKQEYNEWLLHQKLYFLAIMGYRNGCYQTRLQLVEELLNRRCKKIIGAPKFELALDWLSGIMAVHMSQVIVEQGVAHQSRATRRLMEDLGPVCELWLKAILFKNMQSGKLLVNAQSMSKLYQDETDFIEYTLRRMITQLASRLEAII
jgi:hypothetical protein